MLLVLTLMLVTSPALAQIAYLDVYQQEPEDAVLERYHEVRRSVSDIECPSRAICGVVYDFNRTIDNVDHEERRVIFNCKCPNNQDCPFVPAHRVFSSIRRREYLCEPKSTLIRCDNPRRLRQGLQIRYAKERVIGSEEFGYYPYFRINCLCPFHIRPRLPRSRAQMELATTHVRNHYDAVHNIYIERRACIENTNGFR